MSRCVLGTADNSLDASRRPARMALTAAPSANPVTGTPARRSRSW
jgi:hypothetical protein